MTWRSMPGPSLWFPLLIVLPAVLLMLVAFSALPEILATFIHRLLGGAISGPDVGPWNHLEYWLNVWATVVLTVCLILALISTYELVERISTVILGIMVVCIATSLLVLGPDIPALISGLMIPSVSDYPRWVFQEYAETFTGRSPWLEVMLYLGAVGGGSQDYVGYIGFLREKRWGLAGRSVASLEELEKATKDSSSQVELARTWTRAPLLDTTVSFTFVILVTLMFAALGALVLNPNQAIPDGSEFLTVQEAFLTALHPQLKWLYRIGAFLAFIGTLYGAFEVYYRVVAEGVKSIFPRLEASRPLRNLRTIVIFYCFLGGLALVWLPREIAGNVLGPPHFHWSHQWRCCRLRHLVLCHALGRPCSVAAATSHELEVETGHGRGGHGHGGPWRPGDRFLFSVKLTEDSLNPLQECLSELRPSD